MNARADTDEIKELIREFFQIEETYQRSDNKHAAKPEKERQLRALFDKIQDKDTLYALAFNLFNYAAETRLYTQGIIMREANSNIFSELYRELVKREISDYNFLEVNIPEKIGMLNHLVVKEAQVKGLGGKDAFGVLVFVENVRRESEEEEYLLKLSLEEFAKVCEKDQVSKTLFEVQVRNRELHKIDPEEAEKIKAAVAPKLRVTLVREKSEELQKYVLTADANTSDPKYKYFLEKSDAVLGHASRAYANIPVLINIKDISEMHKKIGREVEAKKKGGLVALIASAWKSLTSKVKRPAEKSGQAKTAQTSQSISERLQKAGEKIKGKVDAAKQSHEKSKIKKKESKQHKLHEKTIATIESNQDAGHLFVREAEGSYSYEKVKDDGSRLALADLAVLQNGDVMAKSDFYQKTGQGKDGVVIIPHDAFKNDVEKLKDIIANPGLLSPKKHSSLFAKEQPSPERDDQQQEHEKKLQNK